MSTGNYISTKTVLVKIYLYLFKLEKMARFFAPDKRIERKEAEVYNNKIREMIP